MTDMEWRRLMAPLSVTLQIRASALGSSSQADLQQSYVFSIVGER
jgi:hypothetical protein